MALSIGVVFPSLSQAQSQITQGEYIFNVAGCLGCHTDKKGGGQHLAGGRAFKTQFGTFYSPNITPDIETGIGNWTLEDFRRALRKGIAPEGHNYFPAFPYTSYTNMTDADVAALWTYLKTQPPVTHPNRAHDVPPPFGWRWLVRLWNMLNFEPGPRPDWPRGRYVVEALAHCPECHTPRDWMGGYDQDRRYAGTPANPEGITIPNITPDPETGVGKWTNGDFDLLFTIGMLPGGDFVSGVMSESVSHSTSKMTPEDRAAMIEYLRTIPPVKHQVGKKKSNETSTQDW